MVNLIEKEIIDEVKLSLTKSDKVYLFNIIMDYVFRGKDVRRKMEIFVESKFYHIRNIVLDWLITSFDENGQNYETWREWIEEYLGKDFADRFRRKAKLSSLSSNSNTTNGDKKEVYISCRADLRT